jgi:hypothetical protein
MIRLAHIRHWCLAMTPGQRAARRGRAKSAVLCRQRGLDRVLAGTRLRQSSTTWAALFEDGIPKPSAERPTMPVPSSQKRHKNGR